MPAIKTNGRNYAAKWLRLRGMSRNRFKNPMLVLEGLDGYGHLELLLRDFQASAFCKLFLQPRHSCFGARKKDGIFIIFVVPVK
jgi:hypothetical protein